MKKTNLRKLVNAYPHIETLFQIPVSASVAMDIADRTEIISKEFDKYEKIRVAKVREYGTKIEGYYNIPFDSENYEKYTKEINELLEKEVDFDFDLIPLSVFGEQKVPAGLISSVKFMFKK